MNGRETAAAEKVLDNERAVHLIDAVAIRNALLGTPGALTELEHDAIISIVDVHGLDRSLTAEGLGESRDLVVQSITRRRARAVFAYRNALAAGMRGPALDLVEAVRDRDVCEVAELLTPLSQQGLYALAIVLADMVAAAGRDPEADDATPPPP